MKIKRIILSTIFVAGIIVASTSCSQTDGMDDGGPTTGGPPYPTEKKGSSTDKVNDSITHQELKVD